MPGPYSAGSIFLQVVPSFRGAEAAIAAEGRSLARQLSGGFDEEMSQNISKSVEKGVAQSKTSTRKAGKDAGDAYAGAFAEQVKRAAKSAEREISAIKLTADDKDLQQTFRRVQRDVKLLANTKAEIGMDLNAKAAYAKLGELERNLRELQDNSVNIDTRVNTAVAMASIEKIRADLMSLSAIQVEPEVKIDRQMGAFERSLKAAISGAIGDLGERPITFDLSGAEEQLADLRRQLFALSDREVGIDISAETAVAELHRIRDELDKISGQSANIDVQADVGAAMAKLDSILIALNRIDGDDANIDVNVRGAAAAAAQLGAVHKAVNDIDRSTGSAANSFRAFNGVLFGVTTIGPAVIPVLAGIGGALLALGPLAVAGAAGLGVAVLGLSGVGNAIKALNQQQATSATQQQSYTRAVQTSAASVRDAEQSVQQARESAARSAQSSERAVENALHGVQDAERGVTDAQRARQQAQEDLTRAVKDAREQQEDLTLSLRDSQLGEKEAALNLREAQKELADGLAGGATGDDLLELQLRVERYQLTLDQATERTGDLQAQTDEFARTGVEGTDQVRQARQRLADADQNIADAQTRVADAQAQVAQARLDQQQAATDSARQLRDAQERLTDAQTRQVEALENLNSAQVKVNQAMKNLSPAGRDFANFLFGLKDDFQGLRYVAQEGFLPGLQDWMHTIIVTDGPQLQRTIFNLSSAVGDMFTKFGSALLSKPFRDLFDMIETDGPRFIGYIGDSLVNLGKGGASLLVALEPLADFFGRLIVQGTEKFANWAASLQGSKGLQDFFDYVEHVTPKILDFFGALFRAVVNLAKALAPYGEALLGILTNVAQWIAGMDTKKLGAIAVGIIAAIGAMQTIFGLTAGLKSVLEAWRAIDAISSTLGGKWTTLLGSFILLAGAIFVMYQNSETFREVADALWRDVLKPIAEFLADTLVPILDYLGGWFTDQPGVIAAVAAAFAGWKILTSVAGWLKGVRVEAEAMNTTLGKRVGGMAGVGLLAAIGVIGTGIATGQNQQESDRISNTYGNLFGTLRQGGDTLGAQRLLGAAQSNFGPVDYLESILPGTSRMEAYNQAHDAYTQQWQDMTSLEQAQSKVAEWTNTLAFRQQHLGETADETAAAHRRLNYWTSQLETEQHRLDQAATGVNTSLLEQQRLAIALADADIAYVQSQEDLDAAIQRRSDAQNAYNTAVQQYGADSAEAAQALVDLTSANRDWTNQSDSTAKAAAAVAAARHQNADATTKEAYANAALLLDLERQKEKYGELPPRLEQLRLSLEGTVDPAVLAAEKMEELGLKVSSIPDSKTMKFDTEPTQEQIALLESLGFKIEHLPGGVVTATAQTQAAEDALNQVARDRTSTVYQDVKLPGRTADPTQNAFSLLNRVFNGAGSATKKARGGPVWGAGTATSDSIPAWLSNGEFVVRAKAVAKYGLGFLHDVNSMHFAEGGLVPGYAGGGLAANWGGTIDLKGGDVSPLAMLWVEAILQINALAQGAADLIGASFAAMRDRVLGELVATKDGASTILGQQFADMVALTISANSVLYGENLRAASSSIQLTAVTNSTLYSENLRAASAWMQLTTITTGTLQNMYLRFGADLLQLFSALNSTLYTTWASMLANMISVTGTAINTIGTQFNLLRGYTALPVNFVIMSVLNAGLFPALNSISSTFGLAQMVPNATPIGKFATGGRVFGNSPSKTADNIPAWLTAGEYVHPVDSVNYYGADFMEMIRRRQIPREMLPGFASGGQATWQQLDALRRQMFPGSVMTSGYRPGSKDYHGAGMAIDIGVPGNVQSGLMPIAAALVRAFPQSAEIIHNPNASVKNGRQVPSSFWGAATWAQHANHVHWAMTMAQLLMGANPSGYVPGAGLDANSYLSQLTSSVSGPIAEMFKQFGHSPFIDALATVPVKIVDSLWGKIGPQISAALAAQVAATVGSLDGVQSTGPVQDIVRSVANQFGWGSGSQWDDLAWLIQHESGWRPTAQNPTSTAYGLFQFLNSTWASTGIAKTSDPAQQSLAGMRYIKGRYGSPAGAKAFWQGHHWYSEGGPVEGDGGPITPELMDTGGWIHPGLNVIMNKTGRPEPVINPATLDALVSIGEGGAGSSAIGSLTIPVMNGPSAGEIASEVIHRITVERRGGKHS